MIHWNVRAKAHLRRWALVVIGLSAACLPEAHCAAPVAREVDQKLRSKQPVEVIVVLDDEDERAVLRSTVGQPGSSASIGRAAYEHAAAARRQALDALKSRVLREVADPDVEVLTDYHHLALVHARVRSLRALEALRRQGKVKAIDAIVEVRSSLLQSLPLIGQPEAQAAGHVGAGTTVAVLDTGVDYTREAFGSCAHPGGDCKVVFAQDFATADGTPDANGHGTNVAGIVLGVAPGARIAALDVFEANGLAYSNAIIAAINWCIANKAAYNIVAINMSLGGGRHYAAVAPTDAWGSAIASAIDAGIVVVSASGNNAYTDSLSLPAAYSNVVSVGAFYDSAMGAMGWSGCSDAGTAARKVTCFSNSASFLTMLAPGALISSAGLTQGGTSQAAPHVAGAVAVLKASYPDEDVLQIVARLKLGAGVADARNGLTRPGLDLRASMAMPPSTYRLIVGRTGSGTGRIASTPAGVDCGTNCSADLPAGSSVTLTAMPGPNAMFTGWSGACVGSNLSCTVPMTAARTATASFTSRTSEEFVPSGSLPAGWTQPAGSSAAWTPVATTAHTGTHSLRAGPVGDGQTSAVSVSGNFRSGVVVFARRVSSAAGDALRFYIDGQLQGSWSGDAGWAMVSFPISAGQHVLTWAYEKDGAGAAGTDTAWIDAVVLPLAATSRRSAGVDFNGDGRADILWRHAVSGNNALWLMNGPVRIDGSGLLSPIADANWRVVGTGDFDGDGRADVLWRHASSGQNALWTMDGVARTNTTLLATISDLNWRVAAIGDFDGDGKADILWRHAATGQNALWLMDGAVRRSVSLLDTISDRGWNVAAVADLDGDGKADILWRHATSGQDVVWRMSGATRRDTVWLAQVSDTRWVIVAVDDFDGDGKPDILWRHMATGQNVLWTMDGTTRRSVDFLPVVTDLAWVAVGVADFDGDGRADILWRHSGTGRNLLWTMAGPTRLGLHWLEDVTDVNWRIVSP